MALFSKQNKEVFTNPLNLDHPILGEACHRDGTRRNGDYRLCKRNHLYHPQHHS